MKFPIAAAAASLALAACGALTGAGNETDTAGADSASGDTSGAVANGRPRLAAPGGEGGSGGENIAFQPGQWESTVEIVRFNIPGVPSGSIPQMPATTSSTCMTPEQARNPDGGFLAGNAQSGCTTRSLVMSRGRIQGVVQCDTAGAATSVSIDGEYSPTSLDMRLATQGMANGIRHEMEARLRSRRTGECAG